MNLNVENRTILGDEIEKTSLQDILNQIVKEKKKEAELQSEKSEEKRSAEEIEKAKALEMRQQAMELKSETEQKAWR